MKALFEFEVHVVHSRWVLARWGIAALLAAGAFAFVLAHLGPRIAVAG
jgi:hypothetical protein